MQWLSTQSKAATLPFLLVATVLSFTASTTEAAIVKVLQLDFGPTTVTGADLANSPLHTVAPTFSDTTWNQVQTTDVGSGLLWSDATDATGVSLDLGRSNNNNVINFADQPGSSSALAGSVNDGVFGGTSVGRDGVFHGTSAQNNRIGLTLTGLPLGIYDIYVVAINTSIAFDDNRRTMAVGALATASAPTLDTTSLPTLTIANHGTGLTTSWSDGLNFRKLTVALSSTNPDLTIFTFGPTDLQTSSEPRGFLNSVQVVLIPEPASLMLMGLGSVLILARRRVVDAR
jgi:hypothetical protein